jgi:isoleucyl-tRNA synthetase
LSNISDFDYEKDKNTNFSEVDNLILDQLQKNIYDIEKAYENFNFNVVLETINNHIVELSGWYFDIIKDALYCDKKDSENRRVIQTVLFHILKTYLFALAPIVPHTVEEAYTN